MLLTRVSIVLLGVGLMTLSLTACNGGSSGGTSGGGSTGGGGGGGSSSTCDTNCQTFFQRINAGGNFGVYAMTEDPSVAADGLANEFKSSATYDLTVSSSGGLFITGDTTAFEFLVDEITVFEEALDASNNIYETNVIYNDTATGYTVIFQEDTATGNLLLNIAEPFTTGANIADLDNATLNYSAGGSGGIDASLVQAYAGTYNVTATNSGSHTRSTVIIGSDGSIDFDTGVQVDVADYVAIYDRLDTLNQVFVELGDDTTVGDYERVDLTEDGLGNLNTVLYRPAYPNDPSGNVEVTVALDSSSTTPSQGNNGATTLGASEGITGDFGGTVYTFTSNLTVVDSGSDTLMFADGSGRWRLGKVPNSIGIHDCGDDTGTETFLDITLAGGSAGGSSGNLGDCQIEVIQDGSSNIYEGYFTGTLIDFSNNPITVTDGYYFFDESTGGATGLSAGTSGFYYEVGGVGASVDNASVLVDTPNFDYQTVQGFSFPPSIQMFRLDNSVGTFACGSGPDFRKLEVVISHTDGKTYQAFESTAGASCSITVTGVGTDWVSAGDSSYTGTIEGTFNGTFVANDGSGDTISVSNGEFRAIH